MTIPASGPVTGQGINAETGAASTAAVTVNDPYVRSIARKLTGAVLGSDFLGAFGFWIGSTNGVTRSGISVDGSGNIALASFFASNEYGVEKHYLSSTRIYAKSYGITLGLPLFATQASDGITVFCGSSFNIFTGNIYKIATDGTVVWTRLYKGAISSNTIAGAVIDSTASNYYFICDPANAAVDFFTTIVKVNSSGTLQWQVKKTLTQPTSGNLGIARDPSDNIYALSEQSSPKYVNLMKINSSGSLLWERNLSLSGFGVALPTDQTIAVDSSGNVYLVVNGATSGNRTTVVKYNTSGVIQWQYSITLTPTGNNASLTCDPSGNVYFLFVENVTPAKLYITKLTSAGSVSWQRTLITSPATTWSIDSGAANVDQYGNLLLIATYLFRLPSSGAGAGSYVIDGTTVTYASVSLSLVAGALTDSAGGVGLSTASNTFISTSLYTGATNRTPTQSAVALNV